MYPDISSVSGVDRHPSSYILTLDTRLSAPRLYSFDMASEYRSMYVHTKIYS